MKKKQTTGEGGAAQGEVPPWPNFSNLGMRVGALENLTRSLLAELEMMHGQETAGAASTMDFYTEVRNFEIQMITAALRRTAGRQIAAARLLKLKPSTLNSKIKMYNLRPGPGRPYGYSLRGASGGEDAEDAAET